MDSIVRSFPPEPPTCWLVAPPELSAYDADPTELRSGRPGKTVVETKPEKPAKPNWMTVAGMATADPHDAAWFAADIDLAERTVQSLLRQAVAKKAIHLWRAKNPRDPDQWAKVPQPLTG